MLSNLMGDDGSLEHRIDVLRTTQLRLESEILSNQNKYAELMAKIKSPSTSTFKRMDADLEKDALVRANAEKSAELDKVKASLLQLTDTLAQQQAAAEAQAAQQTVVEKSAAFIAEGKSKGLLIGAGVAVAAVVGYFAFKGK